MYQPLPEVELKTGERVECGFVTGPDINWRERIVPLLAHKAGIWQWQIAQLLDAECGIEARFHLLHRGGKPFCHILTANWQGVGLLGHVYTCPADRGCGAAGALLDRVLHVFVEGGGNALFLATGYDTPAFHLYRRRGFVGLEPGGGVMEFVTQGSADFAEGYFAAAPCAVTSPSWRHWAAGSALLSNGEDTVKARNLALGLTGRTLTEAALLDLLAPVVPAAPAAASGRNPAATIGALALQKCDNGSLVGLASWSHLAAEPDSCLVDIYCHPRFWSEGAALLAQLQPPRGLHQVAYCDRGHTSKIDLLQNAGFAAAGAGSSSAGMAARSGQQIIMPNLEQWVKS